MEKRETHPWQHGQASWTLYSTLEPGAQTVANSFPNHAWRYLQDGKVVGLWAVPAGGASKVTFASSDTALDERVSSEWPLVAKKTASCTKVASKTEFASDIAMGHRNLAPQTRKVHLGDASRGVRWSRRRNTQCILKDCSRCNLRPQSSC